MKLPTKVFREDLRRGSGALLDLILPPHALLTPRARRGEGDLALWETLRFLDEPCCDICGFPFEYAIGVGALCAGCIADPPECDHIRAAFAYDDASRHMVLEFKHGGQTAGLNFFGKQMVRAGRRLIHEADYVVPVPLHSKRLISRRYNQSTLLGRAVCKMTAARFDADILERHKMTATQGGRTVAGRVRNVQGAFRIREKARARLQGAHIVLIDDVYTTGATLNACARTLRNAGARRVDALTLARVVRSQGIAT